MKNSVTAIYIHIPFCKKKCNYCDFNSFPNSKKKISPYVSALIKEISKRASQLDKTIVKTIFFGGGTPSLTNIKLLESLLLKIKESANLSKKLESTIEVNPGSVNKKYLNSLLEIGFNRISIGVQSFNDKALQSLGRIHSAGEAIKAVKYAKEVGFSNISIDLIFGIQNQTMVDLKKDIETVVELSPDHISIYNLTPEQETPLMLDIEEGRTTLPDEEAQVEMFKFGIKSLTDSGFNHYEISNFAKPFKECKHNIVYWENEKYVGFGAGAWSYLNGSRCQNRCNIDDYIESVNSGKDLITFKERLSEENKINETIIMNLRMIQGIEKKKFIDRFGVDIMTLKREEINKLEKQELITSDSDRVRLTEKGILFSNIVFMEFI